MAEVVIPYVAGRHPENTHPEDVFARPEDGTNCQLFVVALTMARGFQLPPLRSAELLADQDHTVGIPGINEAQTGDIIALTTETQTDPRYFHVGVISKDPGGVLYVTHNEKEGGSARRESFEDVMSRPKYARIAWIKRPVSKNPPLRNPSFLRAHGFEHLVDA